MELAVEHGFVADELDEALLGRQGADEGSARLAEAVVPLGGFELALEASDLGGVVVDDLLLGLREGVVEVRAGEAEAVQLLEERVARACLPALERVRVFAGGKTGEEDVGAGGRFGWAVGREAVLGGEAVEGGKQQCESVGVGENGVVRGKEGLREPVLLQ